MLNKTPNAKPAKTGLVPRLPQNSVLRHVRGYAEVFVAIVLVVGTISFGSLIDAHRTPQNTLAMGGMVFKAEIVSSSAALEKGLSGRESLAPDAAMVFVFDTTKEWCFWMKDMQFSIDIIWLDEAKRIVHLEPELSPATYPEQYCPATPARYVAEVVAGSASQLGLKLGDQVSFSVP